MPDSFPRSRFREPLRVKIKMCPFEFVATPATSPRYRLAGILNEVWCGIKRDFGNIQLSIQWSSRMPPLLRWIEMQESASWMPPKGFKPLFNRPVCYLFRPWPCHAGPLRIRFTC